MGPKENILKQLEELSVSNFEHLNGDLLSHLLETFQILEEWGSPEFLCYAGLFHAVYGTFAYQNPVIGTNARKEIVGIIGEKAETLVYLYGSCDRTHLYGQFGNTKSIFHKNRFTGEITTLTRSILNDLCELTAANELQLTLSDNSFRNRYAAELKNLFSRMNPYLSSKAAILCSSVFSA
ncbi:DUF6817 domain-containing protein [Leptospira interrogans]|uniref:DUF6817 domain-containing protein n=1 Tax=Leptospira interrogans TaxID=173 RepID=UPI000774A17E|nr:hypothetical protein [Leptospira interrogans]